ncbi:hypothetical protein V3317_00665 [Mycoplasmopsis felis]
MSQTAAKAVYGNEKSKEFVKLMQDKVDYHNKYIKEVGIDIDEVRFWKWEGINKVK